MTSASLTNRVESLPRRRGGLHAGIFVGAWVLSFALLAWLSCSHLSASDAPIRFAFMRSMMPDVNENDAKAALRAYSSAMAGEYRIPVDPNPKVFERVTDLAEAVAKGDVDVAAMNVLEYFAQDPKLYANESILPTAGGSATEEYVILVRQDRGYSQVGDLRGRSLLYHQNVRTSVASHWLEVLIRTNCSSTITKFFGSLTAKAKPALAVLPVYFGQADACLVSRKSFKVMCELNPQVATKLRPIASSPALIPTVTCFRATLPASVRQRVIQSATSYGTESAGHQIMTLFQTERPIEASREHLRMTELLLQQEQQLPPVPSESSPSRPSRKTFEDPLLP